MASVSSGATSRLPRHFVADMLLALAFISSVVFIWLVAGPVLTPEVQARHAGHLALLAMHIVGGTVMLLAGAVGLRIGLTRQPFRWHKPVGYTYLVAGSLASISALIRSFDTNHTPGLSTGMLSLAWLGFTAMGWRAARNGRFDQHRDWMIRSYVLAWTFVFCRFWSRAVPAGLQGNETDMIWTAWIGPILLCEILLQWRRGSRQTR